MAKHEHSNLFNRYIWLVDTIYSAGLISFEDINAKWLRSKYNIDGEGLPKKTFHRHLLAIEELFDIDIECEKGGSYRYYISNSDEIEKGGVRTWLLNSLAVNNLINESYSIKSRILFEKIPSGQHYLKPIVEAMAEGHTLLMTYRSFTKEDPSFYEIEPWCVKVFRQRWYMLGKVENFERPRIYSLDRIEDLDTTENKFKLPKGFDAEAYFAHCFGIFIGDSDKAQKIVIRAWDGEQKYLRTLPWHHSQKEIAKTDSYSDFEFNLKPTFDFKQEILSHGSYVEVLEPASLRDEINTVIAKMAERYTTLDNSPDAKNSSRAG